jgi:hypothetical protein
MLVTFLVIYNIYSWRRWHFFLSWHLKSLSNWYNVYRRTFNTHNLKVSNLTVRLTADQTSNCCSRCKHRYIRQISQCRLQDASLQPVPTLKGYGRSTVQKSGYDLRPRFSADLIKGLQMSRAKPKLT